MQLHANRKTYPAGVPCWVEVLAPDARAAVDFYRGLFGWESAGPGPMPDGGEYFVARIDGDDVAGIATLPSTGVAEPAWTTYVCVDELDATARRAVDAGGRVIVAPLDAPPAGRLAIVEDPTGATFGLWQPHARAGAQRVNEPSAWAMSALRTRDLRRATAFYADVFGWNAEPFAAGPEPAALFRLPGYVGGTPQQPVPRDVVAVVLEGADIAIAYWSADFWIDDVEAAVERVVRLGGSVVAPPFDVVVFRRAVVTDPAGAVFTISQLVPDRLGR
jgi:predicted enzyme related to lactoylglutathione lyase